MTARRAENLRRLGAALREAAAAVDELARDEVQPIEEEVGEGAGLPAAPSSEPRPRRRTPPPRPVNELERQIGRRLLRKAGMSV